MRKKYLSLLAVLIITIPNLIAQDSLAAHWSFDELNGNVFTDVGDLTSHGVVYGAHLVDGVVGKALSFDGIEDYARIPGGMGVPPVILKELGEGSISLWFKAEHIPTEYGIAPIFYYGATENCDFFDAANQGLIIELGHSPIHPGSKSLYFTIWKNGSTYPSFCYDSGFDIPLGVWNHFVAVVGEDFNTGYFNREEMTGRNYNFGNSSSSQFFDDAVVHEQLWLGKGYWDDTVQHFNGALDELKIFNKPISDEEVMLLYQEGNIPSIPSPSADSENLHIQTYPNPVSDILHYNVSGHESNLLQIRLIDLTGRVHYHDTQVSGTGYLDTKQLNSGLYYLEFTDKNIRSRKSIIINH
jgi:hypothetical protein